MKMTHKQRIENALQLKETDKIPYSMWWHVPNKDRHPRRLAELTMQYQRKYDLTSSSSCPTACTPPSITSTSTSSRGSWTPRCPQAFVEKSRTGTKSNS